MRRVAERLPAFYVVVGKDRGLRLAQRHREGTEVAGQARLFTEKYIKSAAVISQLSFSSLFRSAEAGTEDQERNCFPVPCTEEISGVKRRDVFLFSKSYISVVLC